MTERPVKTQQTCNDCTQPDQAHCILKQHIVDAVRPTLQHATIAQLAVAVKV